ncbi:DivIVA domain-containing protein, partial [Nostocoides sp.]|uniref:DivIVA domain-containing protein n=1 Tax=Nostocoides sp. TaxID=1917966 RepID=UPI003BB06379
MSLTPEDVLNKTFGTTQFRRGYDEREVDDFLDEIVASMRRLAKELDDCRAGGGGALVAGAGLTGSVTAAPDAGLQARLEREAGLRHDAERALAELQERVRHEDEQRIAAAAAAGDADEAVAEQRIADANHRADEAEQAARVRIDAANARADEAEEAAQARLAQLQA